MPKVAPDKSNGPDSLPQDWLIRPAGRRLLAYFFVLILLGGVFMLYLQPEMMVVLADQLWSCF